MEHALSHHFLISMPALANDPHFGRTLIYLCEHSADGAMGLIVNRLHAMPLSELMKRMEPKVEVALALDEPVFAGGPVGTDRGFVLHRDAGQWQATLELRDGLRLTTSRDILDAIVSGQVSGTRLIALGYCGWAPGQLEEEIAGNSWLTVPADPAVLFDTALEDRIDAALRPLGINYHLMTNLAGHA